ncbi:S9 family peptidase [Austwickia sp. TVS 96-490-7B]|uniref:alpha/beta hydrolase family protein n=1 Tax=Austwickia sp. TVS 96-490-7B TaxID=2830843 RepID=UPI001C5637EE|nr:alpha/beta fold hydrolase [Austwickia sp. TVS 96-490-7B]
MAGTAGGIAAGGAVTIGLASYALRRMLTPERDRPDNIDILDIPDPHLIPTLPVAQEKVYEPTPARPYADIPTITLRTSIDCDVPGRYGLWLDNGAGHVRIGEILDRDDVTGTVTRELLGVDSGTLRVGTARWNGYYYGGNPISSLGLPYDEITVTGPVGDLPTWVIPGATTDDPTDSDTWAVMVHGRGALRAECLRAVPTVHRLGWTTLVPAYRNDPDSPESVDRRYALGLAEWADIDAALRYAVEQGARKIVLFGWSMGGAIVLQTLARSPWAAAVDDVVLDGPVVDWYDVMRHHIHIGRLPQSLAAVARRVLRSRVATSLVGVESPLDVTETDWIGRASELAHRILIIHSVADDFVPVGPSEQLALARPDLVTYVSWTEARHTKEWNTDPARWDQVVTEFLTSPR